jgi:DNA-binding XRE family transcriptional regulator
MTEVVYPLELLASSGYYDFLDTPVPVGYPLVMSKETFGKRLQRLRHEAGLSQAKLARAAGIPHPSLRNWEYDIREPLVMTAAKLARALGVSLDELVGDAEAVEKRKRARKKK